MIDWDYVMAMMDLVDEGKIDNDESFAIIKRKEADGELDMPDGVKRSATRIRRYRKQIAREFNLG